MSKLDSYNPPKVQALVKLLYIKTTTIFDQNALEFKKPTKNPKTKQTKVFKKLKLN